MDALVRSQIAACSFCQSSDKSAKVFEASLQPVSLTAAPWSKLGLDIVGLFETTTWDCKFAVTLTDYYSRWPDVSFASSVNPESLFTDSGPQFTAAAFIFIY